MNFIILMQATAYRNPPVHRIHQISLFNKNIQIQSQKTTKNNVESPNEWINRRREKSKKFYICIQFLLSQQTETIGHNHHNKEKDLKKERKLKPWFEKKKKKDPKNESFYREDLEQEANTLFNMYTIYSYIHKIHCTDDPISLLDPSVRGKCPKKKRVKLGPCLCYFFSFFFWVTFYVNFLFFSFLFLCFFPFPGNSTAS